jgi:hypothetical protein
MLKFLRMSIERMFNIVIKVNHNISHTTSVGSSDTKGLKIIAVM